MVTITKDSRTTESFTIRTDDKWEWASIVVKHKKVGDNLSIELMINSSYGAMSYSWGCCGEGDWRTWLLDTDFSYFMGKMKQNEYMEFSLALTVESCISVMEDNLDDEVHIDALKREMLEKAEEITGEGYGPDDQENKFIEWLSNHEFFYDDYYDMSINVPKRGWVNFWEQLWRPFIEGVQS